MALDKEYFDAIHIEVVKRKYYNANKVEAVLADIRRQAEALTAENERLRQQLGARREQKNELSQAAISARDIYQRMINRAREQAEAILADAQRESEEIRRGALEQQERAVHRVDKCLGRMRQLHLDAIEEINAEWQSFLCELEPAPEAEQPDDLEEKVSAIARELREIDADE